MPYPEEHWLITVGGDAWVQTETWQFGIRGRVEGTAKTVTDQQLLANALAAPTQAFYSDLNAKIGNVNRLLTVKAAVIDVNGHYKYKEAPGLYTYPTPVVGPSASIPYPQVTMAVTTGTTVSRGRAHAGRFYLPACAPVLDTNGRVAVATVDAIEAVARTWILAINATAQVAACAVFSKLGTGTVWDITSVGVGRVTDTMRSRRRSLAEGRTPLAI